ncbi:MAG: alpha/beta hydrolase [Sulfurimonas sp.]
MHKVIDGISVYSYGDSRNQAIIFIHGFPFDHTLWDEVIAGLEERYYCITYDIRGFGTSEIENGQYTMESYVDDLERILSSLEVDHPIICGFSMGGYITLRAQEKFQKRFKALILAHTKTESDSDEAKLKRAAALSSIDRDGVAPFLENFFSAAFSEGYRAKEPKKLEALKRELLRFSPIGIKGGLLAMVSRTDTTQSLQTMDIPVLLITGENDTVIAPEVMQKMANRIENSTFVSLEQSGHMSMIEKPHEFLTALQRFLSQEH